MFACTKKVHQKALFETLSSVVKFFQYYFFGMLSCIFDTTFMTLCFMHDCTGDKQLGEVQNALHHKSALKTHVKDRIYIHSLSNLKVGKPWRSC